MTRRTSQSPINGIFTIQQHFVAHGQCLSCLRHGLRGGSLPWCPSHHIIIRAPFLGWLISISKGTLNQKIKLYQAKGYHWATGLPSYRMGPQTPERMARVSGCVGPISSKNDRLHWQSCPCAETGGGVPGQIRPQSATQSSF